MLFIAVFARATKHALSALVCVAVTPHFCATAHPTIWGGRGVEIGTITFPQSNVLEHKSIIMDTSIFAHVVEGGRGFSYFRLR